MNNFLDHKHKHDEAHDLGEKHQNLGQNLKKKKKACLKEQQFNTVNSFF